MSGKENADDRRFQQDSQIELNFAIGDLAIAAKLMQKGSVLGMAEVSRLLRNVWGIVRNGVVPVEQEEWKAVAKSFFKLSAEYRKRSQEVGQKIIIESDIPGEIG
jgi:hypothetical protein